MTASGPAPNPNRTLLGVGPFPLPMQRVARASYPTLAEGLPLPPPELAPEPVAQAPHLPEPLPMLVAPLPIAQVVAPPQQLAAPLVAQALPSAAPAKAKAKARRGRVTAQVRAAQPERGERSVWPIVAVAGSLALAALGLFGAHAWEAWQSASTTRGFAAPAALATSAPSPERRATPREAVRDPRAWWNRTMAMVPAAPARAALAEVETVPTRRHGGTARAVRRAVAAGGVDVRGGDGQAAFGPQLAPGVAQSISTTIRGQAGALR